MRDGRIQLRPSDGVAISCDVERALELLRHERRATTNAKYGRWLSVLAGFLDAQTQASGLRRLVEAGPVEAHLLAYQWRDSLVARGLSPAAVAQAAAALNAAWSILQRLGVVMWPLRLKGPKVTALKDTRGPTLMELRRLAEVGANQPGLRGLRDAVLIALLAVLALRREEVACLTVDAFDAERGRLRIRGKGRDDSEWISVPAPVGALLARYLAERGGVTRNQPLVANLDRSSRTEQRALSGAGIYHVVRRLGVLAGLTRPLSPHALRHAAITAALDGTGGDVRRVRAFSRHVKLETVLVYDDHRRDAGGEVAALVIAAIGAERFDRAPSPGNMPAGRGETQAPEAREMLTGMGVSVSIGGDRKS